MDNFYFLKLMGKLN